MRYVFRTGITSSPGRFSVLRVFQPGILVNSFLLGHLKQHLGLRNGSHDMDIQKFVSVLEIELCIQGGCIYEKQPMADGCFRTEQSQVQYDIHQVLSQFGA